MITATIPTNPLHICSANGSVQDRVFRLFASAPCAPWKPWSLHRCFSYNNQRWRNHHFEWVNHGTSTNEIWAMFKFASCLTIYQRLKLLENFMMLDVGRITLSESQNPRFSSSQKGFLYNLFLRIAFLARDLQCKKSGNSLGNSLSILNEQINEP